MARRRYISAGTKFNQFGFIDENGFFIGANPTAPSAGATVSNARQLYGMKNAAPTIPQSESVPITGDDGKLGEVQFDSIETTQYTATMAVEDLDNEAALSGTIVVDYGDIQELATDIQSNPFYNILVLHAGRANAQDDPKGLGLWTTYIMPLATAQFLGRDAFAERAAGTYSMSIVRQKASYNPLGYTITEARNGTCASGIMKYTSKYPLALASFTGNAVATAFTGLEFDPISASNGSTLVAVDRVTASVSSVQTGTIKGFTLGSAPRNGGRGIVLYQFDPASC